MSSRTFDPASLDESITVVTATGRLARAVREAHAAARRLAGEVVWRTPDVLPWVAWVSRCFQQLRSHGHVQGSLLPAASREALWAQVVADDADGRVLSPRALSRAAAQAQTLLHDHIVDIDAVNFDVTAETRAFARWCEDLQRRCADKGYMNTVDVVDALIGNVGDLAGLLGKRVVVLGYDDLPARHGVLLDKLAAAGVDTACTSWRHSEPARHAYKIETEDPSAELTAVARWCARLIAAGEPGPIGVLISDLDKRLGAVKDRFEDLISGVQHCTSHAFHISLGPALAQREMVADALVMLSAAAGARAPASSRSRRVGMAVEQAGRLLLSVHVHGALDEHTARAALHAEILEAGLPWLTADRMIELATTVSERIDRPLDAWIELIERIESIEHPHRAWPSTWAAHIGDVLRAYRWPGDRALDSAGHQTIQAWNDMLDAFAALDDTVDEEIGHARAMEMLRAMAAETIFAPKAQAAPVQIMGLLEATGLSFTHLWVCGLDESSWPPVANPTALLPYDVQRDGRMPNASPALALERAQRMTRGWLHAASEEVVLSYAATEGDAERKASPLLNSIASREADAPGEARPSLVFDRMRLNAPAIESFIDWQAPPLATGSIARGGSNALKDYAACPFRAFARHRLSATSPQERPAPPDPIMRGQILHDAARAAWHTLRTYDALVDASDDDLLQVALDAVNTALKPFVERYEGVLDARTIDIERSRSKELLRNWLVLERQRPPFEVLGHEREVSVELAGLKFSLRLDRIDRLNDGKALLIDYKTGKSNSPTSWMGERPDEPQLPLYALAWTRRNTGAKEPGEVGAIAFGQIHRAESGFKGLGQSTGQPKGVGLPEKSRSSIIKAEAQSWSDWRTRSDKQLLALASGYASGNAAVQPKNAKACAYCDLHALCRVAELNGTVDLDELTEVLKGADR